MKKIIAGIIIAIVGVAVIIGFGISNEGFDWIYNLGNNGKNVIIGDGIIQTKEFEPNGGKKIDIEILSGFTITSNNTDKIKITADSNILEMLSIDRTNDRIFSSNSLIVFRPSSRIEISIPKNAEEMYFSGAVDMVNVALSAENVTIIAKGTLSGLIELQSAQSANIEVKGVMDVRLIGQCNKFTFKTDGIGDLDSTTIMADEIKIIASGMGDMSVWAKNSLNIDAKGMWDIDYKGSPHMTISKSGALDLSQI